MTDWFWVPWIITCVTAVVGLSVTRYYKRQDRIFKSLEEINKLILKCEDDALAYWVKKDDKVYDYQLTLNVKRLSNLAVQLAALDGEYKHYSGVYLPLKRAITLHPTSSVRPVAPNSERAQNIMIASVEMQNFYVKK